MYQLHALPSGVKELNLAPEEKRPGLLLYQLGILCLTYEGQTLNFCFNLRSRRGYPVYMKDWSMASIHGCYWAKISNYLDFRKVPL